MDALQAQLTATLAVILVALLKAGQAWLQTKVAPEKLGHVTDLARMAVRAAEQVGADSQPPPAPAGALPTDPPAPEVPEGLVGTDKYAMAADALVTGARRLGIRLKPAEVTAFIHCALKEMREAGDQPEAAL